MIPYGRQSISDVDVQAVVDVLRSDFLTQGPMVPRFEDAVATKVGAKFGVAANSATSALHIACLALGLGPGDEAWTSPNTFVASANCVRYCGANVNFVDTDTSTYNLDPAKLAEKLKDAEKTGTLPKVVIPVHFAGQPCDMAAIHELRERYRFLIIEDASHAIGARFQDTSIGDCRYSDVTVFSFHPVKIITSGEGGLALTNDCELAHKMGMLRNHGITRDPKHMVDGNVEPWSYQQLTLGFNYRMTDLQAALGLSQLQNLDDWISRRHDLADRYDSALLGMEVVRPVRLPNSRSSLHLYPIQVERRHQVFAAMRAAGIGVNVHYIPVHTQPDFQKLGFRVGQFPQSEHYYSRAISLPMYSALTNEQQDRVIEALASALR